MKMKKIIFFILLILSTSMLFAYEAYAERYADDFYDISGSVQVDYEKNWVRLSPDDSNYGSVEYFLEFKNLPQGYMPKKLILYVTAESSYGDDSRTISLDLRDIGACVPLESGLSGAYNVHTLTIDFVNNPDYWNKNDNGIYIICAAGPKTDWYIYFVKAYLTYEIPKPDLSLESLNIEPNSFISGESVSISGTIKNNSPVDFSGEIDLELQIDGKYFSTYSLGNKSIPNNSSITFNFNKTISENNGEHNLKVIIKSNPSDSNLTNNSRVVNFTIAQPDLQVVSASFTPQQIVSGDLVKFLIYVKNNGPVNFDDRIKVDIYAGSKQIESVYDYENILSGETGLLDIRENIFLSPGTYDIKIIITPDIDSNTSNNVYICDQTLEVVNLPPDLIISNVDFVDPYLVEGKESKIYLDLKNQGSGDFSGNLDIYIDVDGNGSIEANETFPNVSIIAGGSKRIELKFIPSENMIGKNRTIVFSIKNATGEEEINNNTSPPYNVMIRPVFKISGHVYAGEKIYGGVENVTLTLTNNETSQVFTTITSYDGSYAFENVEGYYEYKLIPSKEGHEIFEPASETINSEITEDIEKIFYDKSVFTVTGKVIFIGKDWDNLPVKYIKIFDKQSGEYAITDEVGQYKLSLLIGEHEVEAIPDVQWQGANLNITPSQIIMVKENMNIADFEVNTYRIITGKITSAGANGKPLTDPNDPSKGILVNIECTGFYAAQTFTDPETGIYRVEIPPNNPGESYTVTPETYGDTYKYGEPYQIVDVSLKDATGIDFKIPIPAKLVVQPEPTYFRDEDKVSFDVFKDGEEMTFTIYATDDFNDYVYNYRINVFLNGTLIDVIEVPEGSEVVNYSFVPHDASLDIKNLHFEVDGLSSAYCGENEGSILHVDRYFYVTGLMPLTENSSSTIAKAKNPIPLFVLHDPPTDHGYSYIEKSTTKETKWGMSLEGELGFKRTFSAGLNVEILHAGVERSLGVTISGGFHETFNVIEKWVERTETSSDENPDLIGPGKGDIFCAILPVFKLSITNKIEFDESSLNVYKDEEPIIILEPIKEETETVYITAYKIINDYLNNPALSEEEKREWEKFLKIDLGLDNEISSDEIDFADKIDSLLYTGGIVNEYSHSFTNSTETSFDVRLEIEASFAMEAGLKIGVDLGGTAEVNAKLSVSGFYMTNNVYEKTTGVVLNDDDADDSLNIIRYIDKRFGTPIYLRGTGTTSRPWEGEPTAKGLDFKASLLGDPDKTVYYHSETDCATYVISIENTGLYDDCVVTMDIEDNPKYAKILFNGEPGPISISFSKDKPLKSVQVEVYPGPDLDIYKGFDPLSYPLTITIFIENEVFQQSIGIKSTFIDNIPPQTFISSPEEGMPLSGTCTFYIDTEFEDIEKIDLQISKDRNTWQTIDAATEIMTKISSLPRDKYRYKITWDTSKVNDGNWYFRTIGYDKRLNYESSLKTGQLNPIENTNLLLVGIEPTNHIMEEWSTPIRFIFNKEVNPDSVILGQTLRLDPSILELGVNLVVDKNIIEVRFKDETLLKDIEDYFSIILTKDIKSKNGSPLNEEIEERIQPPNPKSFRLIVLEPTKDFIEGMFIPVTVVKPPDLSLFTFKMDITDLTGKIIFEPEIDSIINTSDYENGSYWFKVEDYEGKMRIYGSITDFKPECERYAVLFYIKVSINASISENPNIQITNFEVKDKNGVTLSFATETVYSYDYWRILGDLTGDFGNNKEFDGKIDYHDLARFAAAFTSKKGDENYYSPANIGPRENFSSGDNNFEDCYHSGVYIGNQDVIDFEDLGIFIPMYLQWNGNLDGIFRGIIRWLYENGGI